MSLIEKSTCKITVKSEGGISEEKGTGFFINKNQILTCKHVIEKQDGNIIIEKCHNRNGEKLTAEILDSCDLCDYALLQLNEDFESEHFLELCDSEIVEEERIEIFGYPKEGQGQDTGEILQGKVLSKLEGEHTIQDVSLKIDGYNINTGYGGFSGSPVVNEYGYVTSIVKYEAARTLSSVSIKKAKPFLEKNSINLKPDQLQSFDHYKNVFNLFPEDIKNDCEAHSGIVVQKVHPNNIIEELVDDIFYPKKNKNISEIIKELKSNKDLNTSIWKGWVKLLTYVNMIKGDYTQANHIKFTLNDIDVKKLYGDEIKMEGNVSIPLKISFYFTESKSFFQIARTYIQMQNNHKHNNCSIFNSNEEHFSLKKFSNADKVKIISNISGNTTTAFKIEERIHVGVLSLNALTEQIINSSDLNDVNINIEKLFLDAIK